MNWLLTLVIECTVLTGGCVRVWCLGRQTRDLRHTHCIRRCAIEAIHFKEHLRFLEAFHGLGPIWRFGLTWFTQEIITTIIHSLAVIRHGDHHKMIAHVWIMVPRHCSKIH